MFLRMLIAAGVGLGFAGADRAQAQPAGPTSQSGLSIVTGPSPVRPEFTRPGGLPGAARGIAGDPQYMIAPVQPSDQTGPSKHKRRR